MKNYLIFRFFSVKILIISYTMKKFYLEYADFITPILKELNLYHE